MFFIFAGHFDTLPVGTRLNLEANDSEALRRALKRLDSRSDHPMVIKDVIKNTILVLIFYHFTDGYSIVIILMDFASFWVSDDYS